MAIGRGKLERKIFEKAPRTGRKKVSKKKTSKKDIQSAISGLFGGTGGGRGEPKDLPESITIPGIGEIELPKQKRKTKAKKADAKPDIGRPKKVKAGKKRPPKVRITEAKPKVKPIDIPEIINIPGIGQIELPKPKPKAKAKPKAKPKPKAKAKAKVKARPKPKPRPVKLPDILQEDIRIAPGTLAGLIGGAGTAKEKPKPKKEVKTPKKGKIREREDIRVPTREEIDKVIKDLDIKIPEVINIPGVGQVTIPAVSKPPVDTPKPSLPEGVLPGGKFYDDPITGDPMYQPPMSGNGIRSQVLPTPINLKTGKAEESEFILPSSPPMFDEGPKELPKDVSIDIANKILGRDPSPDLPPAPEPPIRVDTTPEPAPPPPPQFIDMDPLKGMRDTIIPRNILGQSFDPSVRDDYEKQMQAARAAMMQPGGNIRATEYPTYQTPTLAVPQTQFGGYGQPMPVAPLLPYAGLATSTPPQEIPRPPASGARVNPGTGKIEPVGIAPDPRLLNLPPGVSGPIR